MPVPPVLRPTRGVCALVLLLACGSPAAGQIIGWRLPEALHKKAGKFLIERNGERVVVCERVSGFTLDAKTGEIKTTGPVFTVCVPDWEKPDAVLYDGVDKDGQKKPAEGRRFSVAEKELGALKAKFELFVIDHTQTLTGLRLEYLRKRDEIEAKRKTLGGLKLGTTEWFDLQRTLLVDVDGLVGWLRATGFTPAAVQWEKQYAAEIKKAGASASKSRLEEAKRVVKGEVPDGLVERTKEGGKGDLKWHVKESKHLRIVAHGEIEGGRVDAALVLGERIIEAFRTEFIDPELKAGDDDPMPEGLFMEYLFCPDDDLFCAHLWEKHYGQKIGEPRDKILKLNHGGRGGPGYLSLAKHDAGADLEGWVAHTLGHHVAEIAFNGGNGMPAWCAEGLAYWISFEHLARNGVTCFAWSKPEYARAADKEGEKRVEEGLRAAFTSLALTQGPTMSDLFMTPLASMEGQHLAKAWSVVDWLIERERPRLREFIRAACAAEERGRTQSEKLRPRAMEIFDVKSGDVYVDLEERWRKFATSTGGEARANKKKKP